VFSGKKTKQIWRIFCIAQFVVGTWSFYLGVLLGLNTSDAKEFVRPVAQHVLQVAYEAVDVPRNGTQIIWINEGKNENMLEKYFKIWRSPICWQEIVIDEALKMRFSTG
jgi:hypothetical protein